MADDQLVRPVVIAAFLLVLPIAIYHRAQSEKRGEKLDRRQEGTFVLATLRPLGFACWMASFAWMISPRWMSWSSIPVPDAVRWIGVLLFVAGCGLMAWTFRSLGRNLTDTVVTRQAHTLVSHGPYRWIRHPLYDATILISSGIGLAAANWFILVTGFLAFAVIVVRTRIEERNLLARFGEGYRSYMERTGRFLPRLLTR
jgi:protein-S-isoprenylcysteine O-methyltransferase Ste14